MVMMTGTNNIIGDTRVEYQKGIMNYDVISLSNCLSKKCFNKYRERKFLNGKDESGFEIFLIGIRVKQKYGYV